MQKSQNRLFGYLGIWSALMVMSAWYGQYVAEPDLGNIQKVERLEDTQRILTNVTCVNAELTIYYYKPKRYENAPIIHVEAVDTMGNVLDFPIQAYRRILPDSLFYPTRSGSHAGL